MIRLENTSSTEQMADKKKPERITVNIGAMREQLERYPDLSDEIDNEAWELLSDAQKLVYLAKKQLNQVRGTRGPKKDDES